MAYLSKDQLEQHMYFDIARFKEGALPLEDLLHEAYREGRSDGYDSGYDDGYDEGWDKRNMG